MSNRVSCEGVQNIHSLGGRRAVLKISTEKQFALFCVVLAEVLPGPGPPPLTALGDFSKPRPRGYALYGCAVGLRTAKWHFKRAYSRRNMPYNCLQTRSVRPWFESFPLQPTGDIPRLEAVLRSQGAPKPKFPAFPSWQTSESTLSGQGPEGRS